MTYRSMDPTSTAYDALMQVLREKREPANEADRNELHDEANTLISAGRNLGIALDAFAMRLKTLEHSVVDQAWGASGADEILAATMEQLRDELEPEALALIEAEALAQIKGTEAMEKADD